MLHICEAELQGNQVIWLGSAPPPVGGPRRVVVVLEEPPVPAPPAPLALFLSYARGAMGRADRDAVLAERELALIET